MLEQDAIVLLRSFLRLDPTRRTTATKAMNFPFFDEIRDFYKC